MDDSELVCKLLNSESEEFLALKKWLTLPEQADLRAELGRPVMFHFRAIGDRNRKYVEAYKKMISENTDGKA